MGNRTEGRVGMGWDTLVWTGLGRTWPGYLLWGTDWVARDTQLRGIIPMLFFTFVSALVASALCSFASHHYPEERASVRGKKDE